MFGIYFYRGAYFRYHYHIPILLSFVKMLFSLLFSAYVHVVEIVSGCMFGYGGIGISLHQEARIGDNAIIDHQVTIGGRSNIYDVPVIGNSGVVGANAVV